MLFASGVVGRRLSARSRPRTRPLAGLSRHLARDRAGGPAQRLGGISTNTDTPNPAWMFSITDSTVDAGEVNESVTTAACGASTTARFAPIRTNTIEGNLFLASTGGACA